MSTDREDKAWVMVANLEHSNSRKWAEIQDLRKLLSRCRGYFITEGTAPHQLERDIDKYLKGVNV
jgi:hypothetical protein